MKIAILSFPLILLLAACADDGRGDTQEVPLEEKTESIQQIEENQESSLESAVEDIQRLSEMIDRDIRAKRYQLKQTTWEQDSSNGIEVKEYMVKGKKQRVKLVYKADIPADSHPLLNPENKLIHVMKSYYYENGQLRLVEDVVDYTKDSSTTGQTVHRFYIEEDKLIHWENGAEAMDQTHELYSYYQAVLIDKPYYDLIYAYDVAQDFSSPNEDILGRNRSQVIDTYREVLHWTYPESDTVSVLFEGNMMTNIAIFEVVADSTSNDPSILMRLDLSENKTGRCWQGEASLIGHAYQHRAQIETPGDFYYTMMKIVEKEELDKLRSMIPEQGIYSQATAIVGDIDKPKYDEGITSTRDSIAIEDIRAWFQADIFRFDVHIDEAFDDKGWGTITWYGGGFMEEIKAQKSNGNLYLMEHRSMDH